MNATLIICIFLASLITIILSAIVAGIIVHRRETRIIYIYPKTERNEIEGTRLVRRANGTLDVINHN